MSMGEHMTRQDRRAELTAIAQRLWAGFFSAMTTMLAWKYVSPWAAEGWMILLWVLALFFGLGFEIRRVHDGQDNARETKP